MASIHKYPKRRFWYASYRDSSGKQHTISTQIEHTPEGKDKKDRAEKAAKNRRLAKASALDLEEAERGNATEAKLRELVSRLSQRINARKIEFKTTEQFLNEWIDDKRGSKATLDRYKGTVKQFLNFLGGKASAPLEEITPEDLDRFAKERMKKVKEGTVATDFNSLSGAFNIALKRGYIKTNPFYSAQKLNEAQEQRAPFTAEEIALLLKDNRGTEWETIILTAVYTGLRLGDVCKLTWDRVNLLEKEIVLRPSKTSKRKEDIYIPIHPQLESHLLELATEDNPSAPLCPELSKIGGGGKSGLSMRFKRLLTKAGIEQETIEAETGRAFNKKTFHSLRHTYTTLLEEGNVPEDIRMQLSAHSDRKTHAKYVHTAKERLRGAVSTLPNFNA